LRILESNSRKGLHAFPSWAGFFHAPRGIAFAMEDWKVHCTFPTKDEIMARKGSRPNAPESFKTQPAKKRKPEPRPRDEVDETSEQSFPASDPPSWTPVQGTGTPAHGNWPDEESAKP
jgi:hypothetical protein